MYYHKKTLQIILIFCSLQKYLKYLIPFFKYKFRTHSLRLAPAGDCRSETIDVTSLIHDTLSVDTDLVRNADSGKTEDVHARRSGVDVDNLRLAILGGEAVLAVTLHRASVSDETEKKIKTHVEEAV